MRYIIEVDARNNGRSITMEFGPFDSVTEAEGYALLHLDEEKRHPDSAIILSWKLVPAEFAPQVAG